VRTETRAAGTAAAVEALGAAIATEFCMEGAEVVVVVLTVVTGLAIAGGDAAVSGALMLPSTGLAMVATATARRERCATITELLGTTCAYAMGADNTGSAVGGATVTTGCGAGGGAEVIVGGSHCVVLFFTLT